MLTPFFELDQDAEFVIVRAQIPNLKFNNKSLQLTVDDRLFIFYLTPYYLRLKFEQELLNEDDMPEFDLETGKENVKKRKIKYDVDTEHLVMYLPKKQHNEIFTDLDLPHKLMSNAVEVKVPKAITGGAELREVETKSTSDPVAKQPAKQQTKLIEEIDIKNPDLTTNDIKKHIENYESLTGEEFNWQFKQDFNNSRITNPDIHYGFNNMYNKVIENSVVNGSNDLNKLSNPGILTENERITERSIHENYGFNEDYYVSNYLLEKYGGQQGDYDYEMLKSSLNWKNPIKSAYLKWRLQQQKALTTNSQAFPPVEYSKELKKMMIELPKHNSEYEIQDMSSVYYAVLSLIFSYNLNQRINCGEDNVDSAWLIGMLSPQFSYLDNKFVSEEQDTLDIQISSKIDTDVLIKEISTRTTSSNVSDKLKFNKLKSLIIILVKRSLIYPLYRNYTLTSAALEDTYYTLRSGWKKIIEVLLLVRELFRKHSHYYVYNIIWMNDLINYLIMNVASEQVTGNNLRQFSHEFHEIEKKLLKTDIVFEKLNMGDDDDDVEMEMEAHAESTEGKNAEQAQDNIELLETINLAQLEVIAEELYKDSITSTTL